MKKWLFFDLGSTLIDESACNPVWIERTIQGSAVSFAAYDQVFRACCARNQDGYNCAREHFQLPKAPWPGHLEKLYPGVPEMLERLSGRYALGIIANQLSGLEERLRMFGILDYFQVVAGSGDVGAAKPDPLLFRFALDRAGCDARNAAMVGDRLDNDIIPAQRLGMRTLWVRQGYGALGDPGLLEKRPDQIADCVTDADYDAVFGGTV